MNGFGFSSLLLLTALLVVIARADWIYTKYSSTLQQLEAAENARVTLEMDVKMVASQAESAKAAVERSLAAARSQLTEAQSAKDTAEQSLKQTREQLAIVESAKEAAEVKLQATTSRFAQLQAAKEEAERRGKGERRLSS